jgi:hypothetical protein
MRTWPQFEVDLTSVFFFPNSPVNNVAKNGLVELREEGPKVWGLAGRLTILGRKDERG